MTARDANGGAFAAVRTALVILAPNNSGSTVLREAIAASSGCWHLPREAQHVPGFPGPTTRSTGTRLIWAATPERLAQVTNRESHDWPGSWAAWTVAARASATRSPVMVLSSPPFLFLAAELAEALPDPRFLLLVRNPYATAAGILMRRHQQALAPNEDIRRLAAQHVVACMEGQRQNIATLGERAVLLTYEALCANPGAAADAVLDLVPELGSVDLRAEVRVKGIYEEPLRDMNREAVKRLSSEDSAVLEEVFARAHDVLEFFGYSAKPLM